MNSKNQRGRGDPRNVWGDNTKKKSSEENSPINFADSTAFGPALGQRARPNRGIDIILNNIFKKYIFMFLKYLMHFM